MVTGVSIAVVLSAAVAIAARALPFEALAVIPSEVTIRAQPSFFDLGVALAGGAAGAYATARLKGAAAVIGVAIATALMPPLCTVGIGLALTDQAIARGAGLLFLTNFVAIVFAALAVFFCLGFRARNGAREVLQTATAAAGVVILGVLLTTLSLRTVNEARADGQVKSAVHGALDEQLPGSELLSLTRTSSGQVLQIRIRVQVPGEASEADVRALQRTIANRLNRTVELTFVGVPTLILSPLEPAAATLPEPTPTPAATSTPTATPTATATPAATATPTPQPTPPATGSGRGP